MSHQSELIETDINAYLAQHEQKELLRFLTCGSVDDGKSTLIGRLLYDSKMIYEDQLDAITKDSVKSGTTGDKVDLALLVDGLQAEREQGITIDVAYRYFSTAKRKFIIADTPGHEQYTRNMATGASNCNLAIILIDARHGVQTQTKRHSFITSLLGIKHIIIAVNKMDLVDYSEERYTEIQREYRDFSAKLNMPDVEFIPMSALDGDNVVDRSKNMPWYQGSSLMYHLENVHIASDKNLIDMRFPVQLVNRPNLDFRGFCGTLASGVVRKGDEIIVLPSGKKSKIKSIVTYDGELEEAFAPQAVTLTTETEIDISRGDIIVPAGNVPAVGQKFDADLVWMVDEPLVPGQQYIVKHCSKEVVGSISTIRYRFDVNTAKRMASPTIGLNEIGRCEIKLTSPIAYDPYRKNRVTGAFILIDRLTNATVAAGMITDKKSADNEDGWETENQGNLSAKDSRVNAAERSARLGQKPATLLFTGLTGAGKTTIAYAVERKLFDLGRSAIVLDGENMRLGISKDLGFTAAERSENLRRSAEVAKIINDAGQICLAAFVAPDELIRQKAAKVIGEDQFIVIHLNAPIQTCRDRDESGRYAKADSGQISNFPGVSYEYQVPNDPALTLNTKDQTVDQCVDQIITYLESNDYLDS